MKIVEAGLWYYRNWGLNIVFTNANRRPLHKFKEFFIKRQTEEDIINIINSLKKTPKGVAGIINPDYMEDYKIYVLDVDKVDENTASIISEIAKKTVVVRTRRGFHIWFKCKEELPFISVGGEFDLITKEHLVHLPPSLRYCGRDNNGKPLWFVYKFHPRCASNVKNPNTLRIKLSEFEVGEVEEIIKKLFGREFKLSSKKSIIIRTTPTQLVHKPLQFGHLGFIKSFQELINALKKVREKYGLPKCIEWAFFNYHKRGERWISGMIVVLVAYHLLYNPRDNVKEIDEYLSKLLEDYPEDEGCSLREKLIGRPYLRNEDYLPTYSAFITVPENLCFKCPSQWFSLCRTGVMNVHNDDLTIRRVLLKRGKKILLYLPSIVYKVIYCE